MLLITNSKFWRIWFQLQCTFDYVGHDSIHTWKWKSQFSHYLIYSMFDFILAFWCLFDSRYCECGFVYIMSFHWEIIMFCGCSNDIVHVCLCLFVCFDSNNVLNKKRSGRDGRGQQIVRLYFSLPFLVVVTAVQYRSWIRHNGYDCIGSVYEAIFFQSVAHILSSLILSYAHFAVFLALPHFSMLFSHIPSSFDITNRLCYISLCFISQEYFPQVISFWYF